MTNQLSGSQTDWGTLVLEPEEIFDVVDRRDQVIGCKTRSQVHAENLLHRSVHALAFDSQRRLFLQLRGPDRDCDPNVWDSSVGGHLHSGEDYDAAIIRETQEELGIELASVPEKLFKIEASPQTGHEFCWVYRIFHNGPFQIDPSEAADGRWFFHVELERMITNEPQSMSPSFMVIWQQYKQINFGNE